MFGPRNPGQPKAAPVILESLPNGDQVSVTRFEDGHLFQVAVPRGSRALERILHKHIIGYPLLDVYSPDTDLDDPFLYFSFWRAAA
jgi:hypothetical protein